MAYFYKGMKSTGWLLAHLGLAFIVVLLFLGIVLPNTGRIVVDHTTTPPTAHVVGRLHHSLFLIGIVAVPFLLIAIGIFWRSGFAILGWILMAMLMALVFMG